MRLFFPVSFGYTLLRQNRQTDQLAVDVQEHLWAVKTFFIVDQLFLAEALEVFCIRRSSAEEERAGDDVIEISIFIPESPIEWETVQFSLLVANQGYRFLEGINGLNITANNLLHGFQGVWNVNPFWFLLRFTSLDKGTQPFAVCDG